MRKKDKILICDDEKGIVSFFKGLLSDEYELFFADNGLQALEHVKKFPIDLILLDIKMPKMDGIKVLKKLKKMQSNVKIIVITGYSSLSIARKAVLSGANEYISKPFKIQHILETIKKVLQE